MKTYKLIKWYPSLHLIEVGFTVEQKEKYGDYYSLNNSGKNRNIFKSSEVENNPEFWEEVVEKDYEILEVSFKRSERPEFTHFTSRPSTGWYMIFVTALCGLLGGIGCSIGWYHISIEEVGIFTLLILVIALLASNRYNQ